MNRVRFLAGTLFSCLLLLVNAPPAFSTTGPTGAQRLNRSGYISVTMSPLLAESNLWQTSYRDTLNQLFLSRTEDFAEGLAEGLEKTAFRGRLRVLPGYLPEEHNVLRNAVEPDNFLLTVDLRSSYGLSEGSSLAACLSGASCFLLSPLKMFSFNSRAEASVSAFYITPEGKKLRLTQNRYQTGGGISGNFFEAMDLARELEWITRLTDESLHDLKGKILAELPPELVRRSWRKAADDLSQPVAGGTANPPLPPELNLPASEEDKAAVSSERQTGKEPAAGQGFNLQGLVRKVSPSVFKVRTEEETGSGFVFSRRGYGLTSLHVVEGAKTITIRFHNGEELGAKVVLTDPALDVAVLAFAPQGLTPLQLGDSDRLSVGEQLVGVGYPLDLGLSVVTSEVSSLESYRGTSLIRIATPLAPGNSGGPLVNEQGQGVGINFRKSVDPENEITFGIPINSARPLFKHLMDF
jgi:hypothetical protein